MSTFSFNDGCGITRNRGHQFCKSIQANLKKQTALTN